MPKGYHHLTYDTRCQISALLSSGMNTSSIAHKLGVHRTSVAREIKRNGTSYGYVHQYAQQQAEQRRAIASRSPQETTPAILKMIEYLLQKHQWSPEQIRGRMRLQGLSTLSHERIYQHIWHDKRDGGTLWKHLRHNGKKYNKRAGKTAGRGLIPYRIDISERPQIVEEKTRIGDWEADTIIGKQHKGALFSCVDRASKLTILELLADKSARGVVEACHKNKWALGKAHTMTFDNGKEFASHLTIAKSLGIKTYFAKPYRSWERGLNEHTNGLVRQYFPKKSDFSILSKEQVKQVESKLNSRPRKVLGFRTPLEVFQALSKSVTCALQS